MPFYVLKARRRLANGKLLEFVADGRDVFATREEAEAGGAARRARGAIAALPVDDYPALTAAADGFAESLAGAGELDYGLERLLDGLEARLGAPA
jgi:hypothetical protein